MDMLPVPERPEDEQFRVHSRMEIIGLLRELIARHTLVTLYFGGSAQFVLTTILAVNPDSEEIILDTSSKPEDTAALMRSDEIAAVSLLDEVKIQFRAGRAERCAFEDGEAIRIRLPESMLRLQRRNFYRIETPVVRPLELVLPAGDGRAKPVALRVVDLSCGGVGVAYGPPMELELGTVIPKCRLDLPDVGTVTASLEVRFLMHTSGPGGAQRTRCGLQFLDLPAASTALLQRYINKLERERRSTT